MPEREITSGIEEVVKSLEGGRPTTKDIEGEFHPYNYLRMKDGFVADPNKIIGDDLFEGLILKVERLGIPLTMTDIDKNSDRIRTGYLGEKIKIRNKTVQPLYQFIDRDGEVLTYELEQLIIGQIILIFEIRHGDYVISEIRRIHKKDNYNYKTIKFKMTRAGLMVREQDGNYERFSFNLEGKEVRVELNYKKNNYDNFYIGKTKIKARENKKTFPFGKPKDEFSVAMCFCVKGGRKIWDELDDELHRINKNARVGVGPDSKEWYVQSFIEENEYGFERIQ